MAQDDDGKGLVFLLVAFVIAVLILLLYFLTKVALIIGIIGTVICVIVFIFGLVQSDSTIALWGFVGLAISLLLWGFGHAGVNFFEKTDEGQALLDGSKEIVGAGAETAEAISTITTAEADVQEQTNDALAESVS